MTALLITENKRNLVMTERGQSTLLMTEPSSQSLVLALFPSSQITTINEELDDHIANVSNPHSVTKTQVGLGNADNTSDADKPVSTATQTALNLKANLSGATFTGAITASNLSGTNTGDQTLDGLGGVPTSRTINSYPLSSNITLDPDDLDDTSTTNKFVTASDLTNLGNLSGTNTGNQTLASASDTTSHTITLSASGGTLKLVEGNNITLTSTGTSSDGVVTIASSGGGAGTVDSVNGQTGVVTLDADDIDDAATTHKFTSSAEISKLSGIEAGAEVNNISDANATDLTDGGDSTLHYHATDRSRANHTGTQTASTISDFSTAVAATSAITSLEADMDTKAPLASPTFTGTVTTPKVTASDSGGLILEAANGTDIGQLGVGNTANITWHGSHNYETATPSTIAHFTASSTLASLSTATYPSLTELSYVKGATSSLQTQITATKVKPITVTIDGGGSAITTGTKGTVTLPYAMTLNKWYLSNKNSESGSIVIDLKVSGTSIVGGSGNKPTISSAQSANATIASWTDNTLATGTILEFYVDSVTTFTWINLVIEATI